MGQNPCVYIFFWGVGDIQNQQQPENPNNNNKKNPHKQTKNILRPANALAGGLGLGEAKMNVEVKVSAVLLPLVFLFCTSTAQVGKVIFPCYNHASPVSVRLRSGRQ